MIKYVLNILMVLLIFHVNGQLSDGFTTTSSMNIYTVNNRTCSSNSSNVSFSVKIRPYNTDYVYGSDYTILSNSIVELRQGTWIYNPVLSSKSGSNLTKTAETTGGPNVLISGTFDLTDLKAYPPGLYTLYSTIHVYDNVYSETSVVTTYKTISIGYETSWTDLVNMSITPNALSSVRNVSSANTYGGARALNLESIANGFISFGAQIASTQTTGSVFVVFSKINAGSTNSFNPSASGVSYVEYRKTGASTAAVYVKNGVTNTLTGPISNLNKSSVIKIVKDGYTLNFLSTSDNPLNIQPIINFNQPLGIAVFAQNLGDGISNAISSFAYPLDNQYYYLKDEVDESIVYVPSSELRFKFEEDYFDASGNLNYSIRNLTTNTVWNLTAPKPSHLNWITLNLYNIGVKTDVVYVLEVKDVNGNKKYLKFRGKIN